MTSEDITSIITPISYTIFLYSKEEGGEKMKNSKKLFTRSFLFFTLMLLIFTSPAYAESSDISKGGERRELVSRNLEDTSSKSSDVQVKSDKDEEARARENSNEVKEEVDAKETDSNTLDEGSITYEEIDNNLSDENLDTSMDPLEEEIEVESENSETKSSQDEVDSIVEEKLLGSEEAKEKTSEKSDSPSNSSEEKESQELEDEIKAEAREESSQDKDEVSENSGLTEDASDEKDPIEIEEGKKPELDKKESENLDEELEEGKILDPKALRSTSSLDQDEDRVEVKTFEELKAAIASAKDGVKETIVVTKSFEITETLKIDKDKIINLTSNDGKKMEEPWKELDQPKDFAKEGEAKQREVIEKARQRGQEAKDQAKKSYDSQENLYKFDQTKDKVIKRAKNFKDTMFDVLGKLVLGDKDNSINFDGNKKEVESTQGSEGFFFNLREGGNLTLNNGVIANGKSSLSYSGPVRLEDKSTFTMNGGRITANEISSSKSIPLTSGGVYVSPGSKFIMNNGMIDHNKGGSGAIFAGALNGAEGKNLFKNPEEAGRVEINGGNIISNSANGGLKLSGAIGIYSGGTLNLKDGILADNTNMATGGAVFISDAFIGSFDNTINAEKATTGKDYRKHQEEKKAEANIDGGLIYDNYAGNNAGGFYVDSESVKFNRTMILDNRSTNWGGGIYYSFPPRVNKLSHILITENKANQSYATSNDAYFGGPGNGGGIWNCPTGYVHLGDGHSVYVYNNKAEGKGQDLSFTKKIRSFKLNEEEIRDKFYSHVSPVTEKGKLIKFINDAGDEIVIPGSLSYTQDWMHLRTVYSDDLIREAWGNSGAFILGNKSRYGGGIGSNANLETPDDDGDIDFTLKKNWHKDIDKSEYENKDIHADIFIVPKDVDEVYVRSQYGYDNKLYKYGEVTLNKGNNWQARFSDWKNGIYNDLPVARDKGLPFTNEELAKRGLKYLVIERETGYATNVVQKEKGSSRQYGKLTITKDQSKSLPDFDERDYGADFYFYELDKNGRATYIGKSKRLGDNKSINSEFTHPILNNKFVGAEYYGIEPGNERFPVENGKDWVNGDFVGFPSRGSAYTIFVEKVDGGIKFHLPYLWIEDWDDEENYSGLKLDHKETGGPLVEEARGYEFTINNSPYRDAKIKKTWKMLTEEELKKALGDNENNLTPKNKEIPDQVKFYVLRDKKRIVVDYIRDEEGKVHPVYKTVTLTKKDNWEGIIKDLDPLLLEAGAYGLEEEKLEGFKGSYELKKIQGDPQEDTNLEIKFRLKRVGGYYDQDGNHIGNEPFKNFMGAPSFNLIVDGKLLETKSTKWISQEMDNLVYYTLDDENLVFGLDGDNPIKINNKGKSVQVKYYNVMKNDNGYKNLSLNIYLEKDEDGVYSLYLPNILVGGNFGKVFEASKVEENSYGSYDTIEEFKAGEGEINPEYEFVFEALNEELPPEEPEKPEEPEEPEEPEPEEPEEPNDPEPEKPRDPKEPKNPPENPSEELEKPEKPGEPEEDIVREKSPEEGTEEPEILEIESPKNIEEVIHDKAPETNDRGIGLEIILALVSLGALLLLIKKKNKK